MFTNIFKFSPTASFNLKEYSNDSELYTNLTQSLPSQFGDLPNYMFITIDIKLASVFDSEYLKDNNGTHLDREILDDKLW